MAAPDYIDQIPDYLAGALSQEMHQAFEQALEERVDLKEAIVIWQEMDDVLAPAPEDKLLENMARLRAEPGVETPKTSLWWKLGIPLLVLLAASAWFFWPDEPEPLQPADVVTPQDTDQKTNPTDSLDLRQEEKAPENTDSVEAVPQNTSPPPPRKPQPIPVQEEEEEAPLSPVFAANYDPNPLLETEMTEQLRGGEVSLELMMPLPETILEAVDGATDLSFIGELVTDLDENNISVRILLLSNLLADYQQSNFILEIPAKLVASDRGYSLSAAGSAPAGPGLYYYLIEWEEQETYLKIGRLRVE
jgi:hypothetical protein